MRRKKGGGASEATLSEKPDTTLTPLLFPLTDPKPSKQQLTPLVVGACCCLAVLQARHLWQERER